ncbi:MAG TPA: hypothetical protein PKA05_22260, partial [Roseiflexaceae bacterium]|nr:hypothetical protein [Roseiflexaceae bacterium]
YLPARETARLLWATPAAAAQLADRLTLELQASPQLQDLIECAAKVRNALNRDDDLGVRQAAQGLALRAPALLALLNPPVCVESPRLALQAALDLGLVPAGYRDDMLCCLGMAATAADTAAIAASALRLAHGVITMLRANPTLIAGWVEPGLPEALSDGRLERLLTQ